MVRVWYSKEGTLKEDTVFLDVEELYKRTGVEYFQLDAENFSTDGKLAAIREKRGYRFEDEVNYSPNSDLAMRRKFDDYYREHLHEGEEIQFVLEGQAYFDFRDEHDEWIRVKAEVGDMLIVPAGIYHRATLDFNDFFKAKRFFIKNSAWAGIDRPVDDMECHQNFLKNRKNEFNSTISV